MATNDVNYSNSNVAFTGLPLLHQRFLPWKAGISIILPSLKNPLFFSARKMRVKVTKKGTKSLASNCALSAPYLGWLAALNLHVLRLISVEIVVHSGPTLICVIKRLWRPSECGASKEQAYLLALSRESRDGRWAHSSQFAQAQLAPFGLWDMVVGDVVHTPGKFQINCICK